jgi:F-type H+-transporting ATPase subunit gamma
MPSLRDIKKRISSVKNTQKITKAMKMVAAGKLRRAQAAILAARPYAQKMEEVLSSLASRAEADSHPLLRVRTPPKRVEIILLTSDRGQAGAFNANVIRRAQRFLAENQDKHEKIELSTLGRKGRDFVRRRQIPMRKDYPGVFDGLTFDRADNIAKEIIAHYVEANLDQVFLLYNEFISAISQRVNLVQLLPIVPRPRPQGAPPPTDYIYEPNEYEVLNALLPRHLAMQLWRAMLESQASEFGARMSAMDAASKNAGKLIGTYTLEYNRARQAYITKELMEIVSGAEALK